MEDSGMYKPSTALGIMGAINTQLYRKNKLIKFIDTHNRELRYLKNMEKTLPEIDQLVDDLRTRLAECIKIDQLELKNNKEISYARRKRLEDRIESALPFIK